MSPIHQQDRRRTRLVWVLSALAILVVCALAARRFTALVHPERIRELAQGHLTAITGHHVRIGSAHLSLFGRLRLNDVRWSADNDAPAPHANTKDEAPPVRETFQCSRIDIVHDPWTLLRGALRLRSVTAHEPTCTFVYDARHGQGPFDHVFRAFGAVRSRDGSDLPSIELRNAHISLVHQEKGAQRVLQDLRATIRATPQSRQGPVMDLAWRIEDQTIPQCGRASVDLARGRIRNVSGGLPWVSLEALMIAVKSGSERADMWPEAIGLTGRVRFDDFDLTIGAHAPFRQTATVRVEDATLSFPIDDKEERLADDKRFLYFTDVRGSIVATSENVAVELVGLRQGAPCRVTADFQSGIGGFSNLGTAAFDARLSATDLLLPRIGPEASESEIRFVHRFRKLEKFYRNFDPHGSVDLVLDVAKSFGTDEPIELSRLAVSSNRGDAQCRWFPYRIRDVTGTLQITAAGLELIDIRGNHNGGELSANGWMTAPNLWSDARIAITATDVPLDDDLFVALPPQCGSVRDNLQIGGTVDADVLLRRSGGSPADIPPFSVSSALHLKGVNACYTKFAYPLDAVLGDVVWDGNHIELDGISAAAGGAGISIDGLVTQRFGKVQQLDVDIGANRLALDDSLYTALPGVMRTHLQRLRPTGNGDVTSRLVQESASSKLTHETTVVLNGVRLAPVGCGIQFVDVAGSMRLLGTHVDVESITGKFENGSVTLAGTVDCSKSGALDLAVHTEGVPLDTRTLGLLPHNVAEHLGGWRASGPISSTTTISRNAHTISGRTHVESAVQLAGATINHPDHSTPFTDVHGQVHINRAPLVTVSLQGEFCDASVRAKATVKSVASDLVLEASLQVDNLPLEPRTRRIIPRALQAAWRAGSMDGNVDLDIHRLRYRLPRKTRAPAGPTNDGQPRLAGRMDDSHDAKLEVRGEVALRDVSIKHPIRADAVSGTVTIAGSLLDRLGGTTIHGSIDASSMDLLGQKCDGVVADWSFARSPAEGARLDLTDVHANLAGGTLTAQAALDHHDGATSYNTNLTLHDLEVSDLVGPGHRTRGGQEQLPPSRGKLHCRVYVSGALDDPLSKRGGGHFEVRQGHLYRLPIMLAIVNFINLTIPDDAVDDARADFFLLGDRMEFTRIALRGDTVVLTGSGSMSLPDRGVDLYLVSVNPDAQQRVPALAQFMEAAHREIMELHVTGPLTSPQVVAKPFRGINEEIQRLFRKKPRKRLVPVDGISRN